MVKAKARVPKGAKGQQTKAKPKREGVCNEAALQLKYEALTGGVDPEASDAAWLESLVVTSDQRISIEDEEDDLKRELAFYNQALGAVKVARARLDKMGVPHTRPDDYFAEMVKSDKHMEKVKRRMIREQTETAGKEARRKQAEGKKFGKQVQREVLTARAQQKNREIAETTKLRKQRKGGGDDGFDIGLDDDFGGGYADGSVGGKRGRDGGGGGGKGKGKGKGGGKGRAWKEAKYGRGGNSANKKNTAESSADDSFFNGGRGGKGGGKGKGKGGGGGGRGGGGRGIGKKARPGKSKRR